MKPCKVLVYVLCALCTACGASNNALRPTTSVPGELAWQYEGQLSLYKDGQPLQLDHLADQVGCVPESARDARDSAGFSSAASTWTAIGSVTLLAGLIGGTALVVAGARDDNDDLLYAGLGTMGGGFVLGLTFSGVGADKATTAFALRTDAVNRYNDELWLGTRCRGGQ